jgi:predicted dithiol-disulfide oxidoreductase (DUF899 family)
MSLPKVVSREEWLVARRELLVREKQLTRQRDALNADRRRLPMVEIEKEYVFEGPDGKAALLDLFEDRRQLIIGHFMFDPRWDDGCPSCSAGAEELSPGLLEHLRIRDTSFAYVSRAPIDRTPEERVTEPLGVNRARSPAPAQAAISSACSATGARLENSMPSSSSAPRLSMRMSRA